MIHGEIPQTTGWRGARRRTRHRALALSDRGPRACAIGIMSRERRSRQSRKRSAGAIWATFGSEARITGPQYFANLARTKAGRDAGGWSPGRNTISATSPMAPSERSHSCKKAVVSIHRAPLQMCVPPKDAASVLGRRVFRAYADIPCHDVGNGAPSLVVEMSWLPLHHAHPTLCVDKRYITAPSTHFCIPFGSLSTWRNIAQSAAPSVRM